MHNAGYEFIGHRHVVYHTEVDKGSSTMYVIIVNSLMLGVLVKCHQTLV